MGRLLYDILGLSEEFKRIRQGLLLRRARTTRSAMRRGLRSRVGEYKSRGRARELSL